MQYAMLQAYWPRHSRDLLIHTIELHMARNDMRPCSREEAERTVALVPNSSGWAVYDDCADRMLAALLAEGSLPPGAAVPVWVGLDTGGERTYNAE